MTEIGIVSGMGWAIKWLLHHSPGTLACGVSRIIAAFLLPVFLCFAGCVSVPPRKHPSRTTAEALVSHVQYLSQPKLNGRAARTPGGRLARRYIEAQFADCGLVPWGSEKTYSLSFGYGDNVVGVLLGSDTNVASEIVLVSAHYDHLGKQQGKIYPGAADNASGVAVLLETARQMSQHRPKRTVVFAAFDCEEQMLLGSFAFSLRPDVSEVKLRAVVNIDMLGRDFLDTVRNTLFVSGTEGYPALRGQIFQFANQANIRVLPLGSDLIGPRSDHVAFESLGVPCLFFSCGTFKDYHKPSDTPEKLNYAAIERSAEVIVRTVTELADFEGTQAVTGDGFDLEELKTVNVVLSEVTANPDRAGIEKQDLEALRELEANAQALLNAGRYDREARETFVLEASGILAPFFMPIETKDEGAGQKQREQAQAARQYLQYMQSFYLSYRAEVMESYKNLVAQALKYRPGLFRSMPDFAYEIFSIPDDDIRILKTGPQTYTLNALSHRLGMRVKTKSPIWLFGSLLIEMSMTFEPLDCEGTKDRITDFCLLCLRNETNVLRTTQMKKLLGKWTGQEVKGNGQEILEERMTREGFGNEAEWIANCISSGIPSLQHRGIRAARSSKDGRVSDAVCRVILDSNAPPDLRADAIEFARNRKEKELLLALCKAVGDARLVYKLEYTSLFQDGYPFANRAQVKTIRQLMAKQGLPSSENSKTVGDLAREILRKTTEKDFAEDAGQWENWIKFHIR